MTDVLEETADRILSLLARRAPAWQVEVERRSLAGEDGVVIAATHPGGASSQWAFTSISAERAVEMVEHTLSADPGFALGDEGERLVHRELVTDLRAVIEDNGWSAGAVGELADVLVAHDLIEQDEADWLVGHVHQTRLEA